MKINSENQSVGLSKELESNYNPQTETLTHYFSTEDINCYGYILKNSGMNDDEYKLNPVMLWQHELGGGLFENTPKPSDIIVGTSLARILNSKGWQSETKFAKGDLGQDVKQFNIDKMLNNWSVRWEFVNDEYTDMTLVNDIPVINAWKIKEISSCILSGNPFASNRLAQMLSIAKSRAMKQSLSMEFVKAKCFEEMDTMKLNYDNKILSIESNYKLLKDSMDCPDCNGTGMIDGKECDNCQGTGKAPQEMKLNEKQVKDLKNELKSEIGTLRKELTDKILGVAFDNYNSRGKMHSEILSIIPELVNKGIRKFTGKLD